MKKTLKKNAATILLTLSLTMVIIGSVFMFKGYDVKHNYFNSEKYGENAYVGGDAYNFIINGTYFTAYSVLGIGSYIMASIFFTGAILGIPNDETNKKNNEELPAL